MTLTPRQSEIVQRLIEGRTQKEIGADLGLAKQTVSSYLKTACHKFGAKTVNQLIAMWVRTNPH